ncbi:hypothetical protein ElyMa_001052500 [Elysia marginata]|uniref:Uncharacterized protein n=1 Tax=Elysia marginata TaxID=1093978 RepID=A0AAV4HNC8_9GAST|nr:hypothetical protein ElyMa_001052500 [Elysia marginata]
MELFAFNGTEAAIGMSNATNLTLPIFSAETTAISAFISTTPAPFLTAEAGIPTELSSAAPLFSSGVTVAATSAGRMHGQTEAVGVGKQPVALEPQGNNGSLNRMSTRHWRQAGRSARRAARLVRSS